MPLRFRVEPPALSATPDAVSGSPAPNLPLVRRGKVRDVYRLDDHRLMIVASDRISAFDVVLPTPIPGKGRLLTRMAAFWFGFIRRQDLVETHLLSTSLNDLPHSALPDDPDARRWFEGRVTIARACEVIPIECVVRGYLEGSGWKEYQRTGSVCGVPLPDGLRQCDRLPEPIFTPATKAPTGHDENISFEHAAELVGLETMATLRDLSLRIYTHAAEHARRRGIIIADTKFEFGRPAHDADALGRVWSQPMLIDEALTPDSSRFWPADRWSPGGPQPSFDKQFLREHLEALVSRGLWDRTPPGPPLPEEVVRGTLSRYEEAVERLCADPTP